MGVMNVLNHPVKVEYLVRDYMLKKAMNNPRSFDHFHPSAWGQCLRKIAYQYYNDKEKFFTKNTVDDKLERIFDHGHVTHARWQKYLDHSGYLRGAWKCTNPLCNKVYGAEDKLGIFNPSAKEGWACSCGSRHRLAYEEVLVKSEPQYNFIGSVDAIIDVRGSEFEKKNQYDIFVVDLKTIKNELFMELMEPKYEHIVQVNIYMWILGLQGAVLVYENKDNQQIKEFFVPRDESLIEHVKKQSIWLTELLKSRKLPFKPNDCSRSKFPCRSCEFLDLCYR